MGGRESAFLKAKRKMKKVGLEILFSSSSLFFCTEVLFHFCSNLKKKLLPMKRCRRSKTSVKKKMPDLVVLEVDFF
jgi:hypothetical protein